MKKASFGVAEESPRLSISRRGLLGAFVGCAATALSARRAAAAPAGVQPYPTDASTWTLNVKTGPRPRFAPTLEEFPMRLPPGKQVGRTVAVAVAPNGDVFFLHNAVSGHSIPPPEARLPRVVHLSSTGEFINAWGGPDQLPVADGVSQWPESYDNIEVDAEGNVWVFGWARGDSALVKFTPDGRFLHRYGQRQRYGNDASTEWFGTPVSVYLNPRTRQLFIADGYNNHRVVVLNADTGKFLYSFGAFGQNPTTLPDDMGFGIPVHKVACAPDGLLYVCDRSKGRVQEFEILANGVRYRREVYVALGQPGGQGTVFDIAFTPDNKYAFVADGMNMRVWTIDRESFRVLGWTNAAPEPEGDDNIAQDLYELHRFARMPNGDLLLARVRPGIHVMKYLGVR